MSDKPNIPALRERFQMAAETADSVAEPFERDLWRWADDLAAQIEGLVRALEAIRDLPSEHDLSHNAMARAMYEIAERTLDA